MWLETNPRALDGHSRLVRVTETTAHQIEIRASNPGQPLSTKRAATSWELVSSTQAQRGRPQSRGVLAKL